MSPRRSVPRNSHRPDVVALVCGVLLTAVAVGVLWQSRVGSLDWNLIKIGAPLGLVLIGVIGLILSRHR